MTLNNKPHTMKVTIKCEVKGTVRHYTATNKKGETISATVSNSGQGAARFWEKVKAKWPKAYVA